MSTPFMGLNLPSPLVTPGPTWASLLNVALETLDSHDHTPGGGVPITPAALDINDDVDLKNHGLETVKLVNLATNAAALATPSIIHSVNGDLVWINANGTAVPITSGNSIVGSPGSIQNLVSPASAQYSASDLAFRWFSSSGVMAGHDIGFAIFRQNFGSTAPAVSVRAPSTGVTSWTLVLPPTAGVTTGGLLAVLPSGVSEYWYVDNASIESVAQSIRIKDSGVTTAKINAQAVTTAKLADLNVTTAKLAGLAVTEAKIAALAVTTGKIADLNVTEAKLADASVTNTKLGAASITTNKIAAGQVTGGPFGSLAYNTIIGDNLVDSTIPAAKLADGAVTNAKLGYQAITTDKILPGQVTGGPFGSMAYNTIIRENLTSNCVYPVNRNSFIYRGTSSVGVISSLAAAGDTTLSSFSNIYIPPENKGSYSLGWEPTINAFPSICEIAALNTTGNSSSVLGYSVIVVIQSTGGTVSYKYSVYQSVRGNDNWVYSQPWTVGLYDLDGGVSYNIFLIVNRPVGVQINYGNIRVVLRTA